MDQESLNLIAFPVLLRIARDAYVRAIRQAQANVECDDIPRNGTYVIGALARGSIPLSQIIDELGISKQAAGQLVDTLVVRGYLEREADPEDRRRLTLTLTERGQAAAAATRAAIAGLDAELHERVGAECVAHARETLAALFGLGRGAAAPVAEHPAAEKPAGPKRFENQRLDGASFHHCSLARVAFNDVNLSGAAFSNVSLKGAKLTNVNLSGVEINNANISGLKIFGQDIQTLLKEA